MRAGSPYGKKQAMIVKDAKNPTNYLGIYDE